MTSKRPRKPIVQDVQAAVLTKSARRCALCVHLNGDLTEKLGQIAHLDDDRSNNAEDNLAFLCMNHHSVYDSTTSQHKNYTISEIKEARDRLHDAIAGKMHHLSLASQVPGGTDADRKALADLIQLMSMTGSMEFLRDRNFAGFSFDWRRLQGIETFSTRRGPEYEFIDEELELLRSEFVKASNVLLSALATNTVPVGMNGDRQAVPEDWEVQYPQRFKEVVKEIHDAADNVCGSYDRLVRSARKKLNA